MSVQMRKIDQTWVRPEAVESIQRYDGQGDRSVVTLASGAMFTVAMSPDEVVSILARDEEVIRSWGDHKQVRPMYEGTVPRD